jgi:hypothetical protein
MSLPYVVENLDRGSQELPSPSSLWALTVWRNGPALYCCHYGLCPAQIQSAFNRTCQLMSVFIVHDVRHDKIERLKLISGSSSLNQGPQLLT